jgi:hypothetical protein
MIRVDRGAVRGGLKRKAMSRFGLFILPSTADPQSLVPSCRVPSHASDRHRERGAIPEAFLDELRGSYCGAQE